MERGTDDDLGGGEGVGSVDVGKVDEPCSGCGGHGADVGQFAGKELRAWQVSRQVGAAAAAACEKLHLIANGLGNADRLLQNGGGGGRVAWSSTEEQHQRSGHASSDLDLASHSAGVAHVELCRLFGGQNMIGTGSKHDYMRARLQ